MRRFLSIICVSVVALAGCAGLDPHDPQRAGHTVELVNSLSYTNGLSGEADGQRSAWPVAALARHTEYFPMAQLKQCDPQGGACARGVLDASRTVSKLRYVPGGVALELEVRADIGRRQHVKRPGYDMAMAIPDDVAALEASQAVRRELVLAYGKVERIELGQGVAYQLCAQRLDGARQPLEQCDLPPL